MCMPYHVLALCNPVFIVYKRFLESIKKVPTILMHGLATPTRNRKFFFHQYLQILGDWYNLIHLKNYHLTPPLSIRLCLMYIPEWKSILKDCFFQILPKKCYLITIIIFLSILNKELESTDRSVLD